MGLKTLLAAISFGTLGAAVSGSALAAEPPSVAVGGQGPIVVISTLTVSPDEEAGFERASRESIARTRRDPGNLASTLSKVVTTGAPPTYVVYQVWRDADSLRNHFHQRHVQTFYETFERAWVSPPTMSFASELVPATRTASR